MTSAPRPISWVSPPGWLSFGASAFSDEDAAHFWISLCCLASGIAADDMPGRRAEASREMPVRAPCELTDDRCGAVAFDAYHEIAVIRCVRHLSRTTQFTLA